MYYKWRLTIYSTGEILESSRYYKLQRNAVKYLWEYVLNHYVKPYDDRYNSILYFEVDFGNGYDLVRV